MNASDVSRAISAMNRARMYILDKVAGDSARNDLLADLAMASHSLDREMNYVQVKIKESEIA